MAKRKRAYNNVLTEWKKYSEQYSERKKKGLIKRGQRKFGKRQFTEYAAEMKSVEHMSAAEARRDLLKGQTKFGSFTKRDLTKLYKQYQNQGYVEVSTWTKRGKEKFETKKERVETKFRKKESFLRNLQANQLIALAIDSGISREEAIEEYADSSN